MILFVIRHDQKLTWKTVSGQTYTVGRLLKAKAIKRSNSKSKQN